MTPWNPQHFQSHLLSEESYFYYTEQPCRHKTWGSRIFFFPHVRQHLWAWKGAKRHILIFQSFPAHLQSFTPLCYVQVAQHQLRKPSENFLSREISWEQISSITTSRPELRGWTRNLSLCKPETGETPVAACLERLQIVPAGLLSGARVKQAVQKRAKTNTEYNQMSFSCSQPPCITQRVQTTKQPDWC